ncbi:hypothetical protein DYB35_004321 [Aphanomyces astaci]|uniref:Protein kinase domain-containing protein n=1 Tax=Aphanomyces astaci TaxID=112090 RepID=A0A3R7DYC4_APHAT|nr:hypothetical protein DYB35_004321 [Aphanomyces astaci]
MVWWYGPCAAWSCCASISCKENATSIYELSELISAREDGHQVYRATHRDTGDVVALKVLPRSFLIDSKQRRHMRREIQVLTKLNHPNLVRLYDVYESSNTVHSYFTDNFEIHKPEDGDGDLPRPSSRMHSSSSSDPHSSADMPRPSWVSTDGVLVLDSVAMHSADAFIHQADMDMLDNVRQSEDIPLTLDEVEAVVRATFWGIDKIAN